MNEELEKFKRLLDSTQKTSGPHEATFELLQDLAKGNDDIQQWIEYEFSSYTTQYDKSDLALIAVVVGKRGKFESYLRQYEQWTGEDFE